MSESKPVIPRKGPYEVEVEKGKVYWWCACGKSASQPFCDGAHKGSAFSPVRWTAQESGKAWFCGCKHSADGAMCDGSHKKL